MKMISSSGGITPTDPHHKAKKKKLSHGNLQKMVLLMLRRVNGRGFNIVSSNRRGIPDIVAHVAGRHIGIECKVGYDKLSSFQIAVLNGLIDDGSIGIVLHSDYIDEFGVYIQTMYDNRHLGNEAFLAKHPIPSKLLPPKVSTKSVSSGRAL